MLKSNSKTNRTKYNDHNSHSPSGPAMAPSMNHTIAQITTETSLEHSNDEKQRKKETSYDLIPFPGMRFSSLAPSGLSFLLLNGPILRLR